MINGQCLLMACVVFTSFGELGYVSVFAKKVLCMVIIGCCRECSYLVMYDGGFFVLFFLQSKLCLTFLWHVNMDYVYCNWLIQRCSVSCMVIATLAIMYMYGGMGLVGYNT